MVLASAVRVLALISALSGGLVLCALVGMTLISVLGRSLIPFGLSPVEGDFEIVEMGIAFAVFAFLPWVTHQREHATVDILTRYLPPALNGWLDRLADVVMFGVAVLVTWRLGLGMLDKREYLETTFILQWPVWWPYAVSLVPALIWTVVCLWQVCSRAAAGTTPR